MARQDAPPVAILAPGKLSPIHALKPGGAQATPELVLRMDRWPWASS